jgi:hypothetical protein
MFFHNSHGSKKLITCYCTIYDSLGHILLSYIWILSVIISLKVPSHYLIKFMLFLDCLLLKLGVGWEGGCCLGVHLQKLILSSHPNSCIILLADGHEPISVNAWATYFLKAVCQLFSTKQCRELYFLFAWICFHTTCLLTVTYEKESFRHFVIDEISLESSRL